MSATDSGKQTLQEQVAALAPWFHNLHLPHGIQTAPDHSLGDFPANKWRVIAPHLPDDLTGWNILDLGCNAGFYSFEFARRGGRVMAVDIDSHYLRQARWAARLYDLEDRVTFRKMQIYELAHTYEIYELVCFMGVFYHLRYPLLGLDIIARKTRRLMVFQTMMVPGEEEIRPPSDMGLDDRPRMRDPGWPQMAFIERRLEDDPTNWWAPNHACVQALLRSSGFRVVSRPTEEVYLCEPQAVEENGIGALREAEFLAATGQTHPPSL